MILSDNNDNSFIRKLRTSTSTKQYERTSIVLFALIIPFSAGWDTEIYRFSGRGADAGTGSLDETRAHREDRGPVRGSWCVGV